MSWLRITTQSPSWLINLGWRMQFRSVFLRSDVSYPQGHSQNRGRLAATAEQAAWPGLQAQKVAGRQWSPLQTLQVPRTRELLINQINDFLSQGKG